MKKELQYSKFIGVFLLILDFFLIDTACRSAYYLRFGVTIDYFEYYVSFVLLFKLIWILSWLAIIVLNNLSILSNLFNPKDMLFNLMGTFLLHFGVLFAYLISFKDFPLSRIFLGYSYGFSFLFLVTYRIFFTLFLKYVIHLGKQARKVIIVGANYAGNDLYHYFIENKSIGYQFMGFFDDSPELPQLMIKGRLKHLKAYCQQEGVEEIYYALSLNSAALIKDLTDFADENFIHFKIAPDFRGLLNRKINIDFYGDVPIMTFRKEPLEIWLNQVIKRIFDVVFSLGVIIFIFPFVYPIVALLIKLNSRGPVLFTQPRSGRKNKTFMCYKFRTMYVNEEAHEKQASWGDSRITRVGAVLRKTNIDELPQFFNVLLGHMSVVGPRPHMIRHTHEFAKIFDKYLVRHFITPGITGFAQVHGFRGEISDPYLMKKKAGV